MPWSALPSACANISLRCRRSGASWQTGAKLDFRGEHYQHTLMTPDVLPPSPTRTARRR